ncbi:MAG: hypothetical protein AAF480_07860 [Actinomycetota bacterium]
MTDGPNDEQSPPIAGVLELLKALDDADVAYCHWKSNEAIHRTLSAENDLDLLVERADGPRFDAVLDELGYRTANTSAHRHVPGMVDHYRYDHDAGRMIHVQAHYQLVLGDDMTKNFRLPLEAPYLASRRPAGPIPVPELEFEYLIFILRMVIKHTALDAQAARVGRLGLSERRELIHLAERADSTRLDELRREHTPFVSAAMLERCIAAIQPKSGRLQRAKAGRELAAVLQPYSREPAMTDLTLKTVRRFRRKREGSDPISRRRPERGGLLVAIVGSDGSGKSSAVDALTTTFGRHFPTYRFHLGKPPRSLTSRGIGKVVRTLRRLTGSRSETPDLGFYLLHALQARDRLAAFTEARRHAARGALVICDRMPMADIHTMDAPKGEPQLGPTPGRLARWLAAYEVRAYRAIGPADTTIVLRVEPEIAVARRVEQDADFVRGRAAEVWGHDWRPPVVVVDASAPHADVLGEVHRIVWDAL